MMRSLALLLTAEWRSFFIFTESPEPRSPSLNKSLKVSIPLSIPWTRSISSSLFVAATAPASMDIFPDLQSSEIALVKVVMPSSAPRRSTFSRSPKFLEDMRFLTSGVALSISQEGRSEPSFDGMSRCAIIPTSARERSSDACCLRWSG